MSSSVSSLSLESYIELHKALTKGSGGNTVAQMNSLETAWFRAKDLQQLLAVHGLGDGTKKKTEILDKLCGVQLYAACPDLSPGSWPDPADPSYTQQPATQHQQQHQPAAGALKSKTSVPPARQPRITAYMPSLPPTKPPPAPGVDCITPEDLVSLGWFHAPDEVPDALQQPAVLLARPAPGHIHQQNPGSSAAPRLTQPHTLHPERHDTAQPAYAMLHGGADRPPASVATVPVTHAHTQSQPPPAAAVQPHKPAPSSQQPTHSTAHHHLPQVKGEQAHALTVPPVSHRAHTLPPPPPARPAAITQAPTAVAPAAAVTCLVAPPPCPAPTAALHHHHPPPPTHHHHQQQQQHVMAAPDLAAGGGGVGGGGGGGGTGEHNRYAGQQQHTHTGAPQPAATQPVAITTAHINLRPATAQHLHQQQCQHQDAGRQQLGGHRSNADTGHTMTGETAAAGLPAGPGSLSWLAAEIVRFSQEAGVVVVQDQLQGPQLLGHRVGFLLLRPMEHRDAAGRLEGTLKPGLHQAAVIRRIGSSCRHELCDVDCPDHQAHEWCAVRVLTPLRGSTARLELTLDIAPKHRLQDLNGLLALAGQEHRLQDAWVLLKVRSALGCSSSDDDDDDGCGGLQGQGRGRGKLAPGWTGGRGGVGGRGKGRGRGRGVKRPWSQ